MFPVRLPAALTLASVTTLATFWLMHSMTHTSSTMQPSRSLTAIQFIRLPAAEAPAPPPDRQPQTLPPAEPLPELEPFSAEPAPLSISNMPLQGLAIPAVASRLDVIGQPYLGAEPAPLPAQQGLRILKRFPPVYPARALIRKTEGWVKLQLLIDSAGDVADAQVLEAQPAGVFDAAALKAVRRWRFQPPSNDSSAVRVTQKIEFSLAP